VSLRRSKEVPLIVSPSRTRRVVALCALAASAACLAPDGSRAAAAGAPGAPATKAGATPGRTAKIIEGDDHLFMVSAPRGWVLDDTSGMGSRIRCVFYPQGEQWSSAHTVMYVNPLHGFGAKARTMTSFIEQDEKAFKKRSPRGRITEGGTLPTADRKVARVRYFSASGGAPHEAVAYVPESDLVMLLVLSARSPEGFQKALNAYHELVQSYAWVGSNAQLGR